jgi:hypothetical protein
MSRWLLISFLACQTGWATETFSAPDEDTTTVAPASIEDRKPLAVPIHVLETPLQADHQQLEEHPTSIQDDTHRFLYEGSPTSDVKSPKQQKKQSN